MNLDLTLAKKSVEAVRAKAKRHETVFNNDSRLVWHEWGAPENPLLILLHGGFGSWMHWVANVEPLSTRFRVLALDTPGLGESDLPPEPVEPASLGTLVHDGLIQIFPTQPVHLAAFSFGGVVAGQLGVALGDRLKSLTLCGSSGMGLRRGPLELVRRTPEMSDDERTAAAIENLKRLMLHGIDDIDPIAIYVHLENDRMARLRSRRMSMSDSLADALKIMGSRGVQLNGIWGAQDITATPWIDDRATMLRESCPTSQFHTFPDIGHWVAFEAAHEFNTVLDEMLKTGQ